MKISGAAPFIAGHKAIFVGRVPLPKGSARRYGGVRSAAGTPAFEVGRRWPTLSAEWRPAPDA
jgi:hypothetical protein